MSIEWATFLLSAVVILSTALASGIGAAINNRRYSSLKEWMGEQLGGRGGVRERLTRLETTFEHLADCPLLKAKRERDDA